MKQWPKFIWLLILLVSLSACAQTQQSAKRHPQAVDGILDLRQWNFEQDGVATLNGKWEFYWEQLLTDADFAAVAPPLTGFITVPSSWRGYQANGQPLPGDGNQPLPGEGSQPLPGDGSQPLPGDGYATYRLQLLLPPSSESWAVLVPHRLLSAHKLEINGVQVGQSGVVGPNAASMTPQHISYLATFAAPERLDIVVQVSNFYVYQGGILQTIEFGPQSQIYQLAERKLGLDLLLFGAIFLMGLYHLGLFSLRHRDKSPLYFGLLCLLIAVRILIANQFQFVSQFVTLGWDASVRPIFLCGYLGLTFFLHYTYTLFPRYFSKRTIWLIQGINLVFVALVALTPAKLYTATLIPFSIFATLASFYVLVMIIWATRERTAGAFIFLFGMMALLSTATNDLLDMNLIIHTGQYLALGLLTLIFSQAYLLSARFSNAFTQTEVLSGELQRKNLSLQQTQDELRQSEVKYRTLFEDSRDVIFIMALDGRVEAINPACFDLLGYTRDAAMTMNALDFYANPDNSQHFEAAIAETGSVTDFALTMRHKAGHQLECQLTATLWHDETGQIIGYQGIIHDMTTYKEVEAQRQRARALQELNQNLEQRVEAKTDALTEANTALQAEIEQRQSHQQEKDRLLALAQQQGDHLRAMSNWLVEMEQNQSRDLSSGPDGEIEQKMTLVRQNLSVLQSTAILEQDPSLITYVADTIRLLAEMEVYIEQVNTTLAESTTEADPLAENPLLQLSTRERQVLMLTAEGKTNPEIANSLTVSLNTVHTYLRRIRQKLDIHDIPGLIEFAQNNNLLE